MASSSVLFVIMFAIVTMRCTYSLPLYGIRQHPYGLGQPIYGIRRHPFGTVRHIRPSVGAGHFYPALPRSPYMGGMIGLGYDADIPDALNPTDQFDISR